MVMAHLLTQLDLLEKQPELKKKAGDSGEANAKVQDDGTAGSTFYKVII